MDYYDTNFDDADEDGFEGKDNTPSKEQVIFLVDAHQSMFETFRTSEKGENQSYFDLSVRVAADMLKARILSAENDEIALVFFGTIEGKNTSDFDHIYTFQDLDVPDALRIRELDELTVDKFQKEIGSGQGTELSLGEQLKYALWTASQMFEQSTHKADKRILLLTDQDNPCPGVDGLRLQIISRAEQLRDTNVHLSLFPLIRDGGSFDLDSFWRPIIEMLKSDDDDLDCCGNTLFRLDMLFDAVRKRHNRRRPVASVEWFICPNMKIGVQIFSLVQPAVKAPAVYLDAKTNERLVSSTAHICLDTGAVLTHTPLYSFQVTNGDSSRYPKVTFTCEERQRIKAVCGTGLKLIGFKPLECLKDYHQITKSYFVYPDEKVIKGSVTAFSAFHNRMHASKKFALCCYVSTRSAQPSLVALVAQQETSDSDGLQVNPPGFQMIRLPFLDDLRHPEKISSAVSSHVPRASSTQIDLAGNVIKALSLSKRFSSTDVANPHLQQHYRALEAVALQVLVTDLPHFEDETKPDLSGMVQYHGTVKSFKDSIPPAASPLSAKKRKATNDETTELPDSWNWKELMESGRISKLTVPQLKKYLQSHNLPTGGKKSDLINRIQNDLVAK